MTRRFASVAGLALLTFAPLLAPGLRAQAPAKWRLELVATIDGPTDADPFGVITGLALHPDGRLAVVENKSKRVMAFDAQGKSLGMIGRVGGGPGEYRDPYYAAWLGDTVAIFDPGESRVVFLTNGKTPLRTAVAQRMTGGLYVRFYPVSPTKAYFPGRRRTGSTSEAVFIGYTPAGAQDTVAVPPGPDSPSGSLCTTAEGGINYYSWPEASRWFAIPARADGSMLVASSGENRGEYKVAIQSRTGAPVAELRRTIAPLAIPDSTWNAGTADYQKHIAKYGAASCKVAPVRPAHRAPIRAIAVAADGDVWITALGSAGRMFDVFAQDGTYRATMSAPEHLEETPVVIAGNRVAVVAEDADGAHVVRVYRVVK